jgi:cytochrome c oxidase cbb3-type subunit III
MNDQNQKEKELLLDHDYDGIQELDHPLPNWWLVTFYGAIVFGIGYFIYYQLMAGPTIQDNYKENLGHVNALKEKYLETLGEFKREKYDDFKSRSEILDLGKGVYETNCQSCHNEKGAGDIGPNLTDKYWLYAEATPETIYPFIISGSPSGGMPAWGTILDEDELYSVLAYIKSLEGMKHANAKEPQGEPFEGHN